MPKSRNKRKRRGKPKGGAQPRPRARLDDFGFPVGFSFVRTPAPYQDVPVEELDRALVSRSEDAQRRLLTVFASLDSAILAVPALQVLADFALYGLLARPHHDPELDSPKPILQFHVELLQAFALRHSLDKFSADAMVPSQFETIHHLLRESAALFTARSLADLLAARGDPERLGRLHLRDQIRIDTMAIRNWGYASQVRRIVHDLLSPLEERIEHEIGFRIHILFETFVLLAEQRADRIYEHRMMLRPIRRARTLAEAFNEYRRIGIGPRFDLASFEASPQFHKMTLKDVKFFLMTEATNAVSALFYTFTFEDILTAYTKLAPVDANRLRVGLDRFSLRFGDLTTANAEHFFMANPIWQRPLIKVSDNTYFYPIAGLMLSFPLEITHEVLANSPMLLDDYERRRSRFLETDIARLLRNAFPRDEVYENSQWRDPDTLVLYENDALAVVGKHVIVAEAKSGRMRAAGRRGAPSMREDLEALLVDSTLQARRFATFLERHPGTHVFSRRDGGQNRVDIPTNAKVVTVNVTLDDLGNLASQWRKLQLAGVAPSDVAAVPSMSLAAFENVLELLPSASQKLHYLQRRQQLEEHAHYEGDESDLLAFYLYTGFNIGNTEFSPDQERLFLTGMSKLLDPYFTQAHFGITVKPVRQRLSPWWLALISHIERRRQDGWSRIGTMLLNVSYDDQLAFEQKFSVAKNIVRKCSQVLPGTIDRAVLTNGPTQRRDALVAIAYKHLDHEARHRRLLAAGADGIEAGGTGVAWVIGVDVERPNYPYNVSILVGDNATLATLM